MYRDHESLFVLADVTCLGNETELSQCNRSPWLRHHCVSFTDFYAGVCCSNVSSFGGKTQAYFFLLSEYVKLFCSNTKCRKGFLKVVKYNIGNTYV